MEQVYNPSPAMGLYKTQILSITGEFTVPIHSKIIVTDQISIFFTNLSPNTIWTQSALEWHVDKVNFDTFSSGNAKKVVMSFPQCMLNANDQNAKKSGQHKCKFKTL